MIAIDDNPQFVDTTFMDSSTFLDDFNDENIDGWSKGPNGKPTSSLHNVVRIIRSLVKLYGDTNAAEFGPLSLRALQHAWTEEGLARVTVNSFTGEIKRLFKWAVSHELIPPSVFHGLSTVSGLRKGRSNARETERVKPVPESHIDAARPYVSRQVEALIDLQLYSGAHPGEVLPLRPIDLDTSGNVWTATLNEHKTSYRGRERVIYFGPNAQDVLRGFIVPPVNPYLFSPREAEAERHAQAETHRREKQKPTPTKTDRKVRECYDTNSYRKAIERACEQADVPRWTPHSLRHNAATRIRKEFGLEAAQILLGHAQADVT